MVQFHSPAPVYQGVTINFAAPFYFSRRIVGSRAKILDVVGFTKHLEKMDNADKELERSS